MPAKQQRIAVVIGSTRPTRICAGIAAWACEAIGKGSELRYELLDLAEVGLPFLDEPLKAALGNYKHEHTRAWSRTAQSYDGFLFVFPQYNWGYPAVLKNALDYLYREWRGRPVPALVVPRARALCGSAPPPAPRGRRLSGQYPEVMQSLPTAAEGRRRAVAARVRPVRKVITKAADNVQLHETAWHT